MRSKKGLSTIVTTLIIILLVLGAIALIWGPIQSLFNRSTNKFGQTNCYNLNIKVTSASNLTADGSNYTVTLKRSDGTQDVKEVGAQLIFSNDTASSSPVEVANVTVYATKTTKVQKTGVTNPKEIDVRPTFVDTNGNTVVCQSPSVYQIS